MDLQATRKRQCHQEVGHVASRRELPTRESCIQSSEACSSWCMRTQTRSNPVCHSTTTATLTSPPAHLQNSVGRTSSAARSSVCQSLILAVWAPVLLPCRPPGQPIVDRCLGCPENTRLCRTTSCASCLEAEHDVSAAPNQMGWL